MLKVVCFILKLLVYSLFYSIPTGSQLNPDLLSNHRSYQSQQDACEFLTWLLYEVHEAINDAKGAVPKLVFLALFGIPYYSLCPLLYQYGWCLWSRSIACVPCFISVGGGVSGVL